MESPIDEPVFMLLVPVGEQLPDLHDRNDAIQPWLVREGAQLPMATMRVGGGITVCYGVGLQPPRNIRAETALSQLDVNLPAGFSLFGPVVFTNVTARQAFSLLRDTWESAREEVPRT